jgi:hypothetical protein
MVLGNIKYENQNYALEVIEYKPINVPRYNVLKAGGVHGNEPAGVESINKIIENCYSILPDDIAMDFIICMNPWGYTHNQRENGNRIDLNRDFERFKSKEAILIRKYLDGKKYDLIIDHHENNYSDGFSIITFDKSNVGLVNVIIGNMVRDGYYYASILKNVANYRNGLTMLKMNSKKGFLQYASFVSCEPDHVFAFETPTKWNIDKRIDCHVQFVKEMEERDLK